MQSINLRTIKCQDVQAEYINQLLVLLIFAIFLPIIATLPITPTAHRLLLHAQQHRQKEIEHKRFYHHHYQSHHHSTKMSTSTQEPRSEIPNHNKPFCKLVNERLNQTLKQSDMSYSYIRNLMDYYTMAEFKKLPTDVHKEWAEQPLHFNHEIERYMQEDFDKLPTPSDLKHLNDDPHLNTTELTKEMQKIYLCLNTLKLVFEDITNDRSQNHSQILHDLLGRTQEHTEINNYFKTVHEYIKTDLNEATLAMQDLNIPQPKVITTIKPKYIFDLQRRNREWLSAKEHLKVLQYIRAIYKYFLDKTCVDKSQ